MVCTANNSPNGRVFALHRFSVGTQRLRLTRSSSQWLNSPYRSNRGSSARSFTGQGTALNEIGIAPRAYLLSRMASAGLVQTALAAFSITPLSCVIIFDLKDQRLANEFGELVVMTDSETHAVDCAIEIFKETQMPSLVIGSKPGIIAIHEDGTVEVLPWQDQNFCIN